jgi:hypothetical protein
MRKLAKMFVFLALTGIMTACGDSPTGLADSCEEGAPSPNSYCEPGG